MNDPEHLIKGLISGQPNPIRESMTRVVVGGYTVRVWRDEPLEGDLEQSRTSVRLRIASAFHDAIRDQTNHASELRSWIKRIAALDRVAAVELLDADGCGEIVYPDWK